MRCNYYPSEVKGSSFRGFWHNCLLLALTHGRAHLLILTHENLCGICDGISLPSAVNYVTQNSSSSPVPIPCYDNPFEHDRALGHTLLIFSGAWLHYLVILSSTFSHFLFPILSQTINSTHHHTHTPLQKHVPKYILSLTLLLNSYSPLIHGLPALDFRTLLLTNWIPNCLIRSPVTLAGYPTFLWSADFPWKLTYRLGKLLIWASDSLSI